MNPTAATRSSLPFPIAPSFLLLALRTVLFASQPNGALSVLLLLPKSRSYETGSCMPRCALLTRLLGRCSPAATGHSCSLFIISSLYRHQPIAGDHNTSSERVLAHLPTIRSKHWPPAPLRPARRATPLTARAGLKT
ncbi:uncharacterized protein SCHCODRAFT_02512878 [Schizophyllum commune H4-8]|uniref:uncharacterized protein n=1 Tax=Schizophyllum commune (strain H4-8 / FGSC 9210) TaxID=578458 RepID=UPI00215FF0DD|nr:uncharacterized protein SCHCODRAFT_02512878 [Schizophyllum commune H4-8]KAI5888101.1 hypothetical protein SCHCODRAFT_02512878 [Schizophyllum commune H4-8]